MLDDLIDERKMTNAFFLAFRVTAYVPLHRDCRKHRYELLLFHSRRAAATQ